MTFATQLTLGVAFVFTMGCASSNGDAPRAVARAPESQRERQPNQSEPPRPTSHAEHERSPAVPDAPAIPPADVDTWALAEGVIDKRITLIRYRPGLREFLGHPAYPRRLTIAWKYGDDGKSGLPSPEQAETLNAFEDRVVSALELGRIAVLAFVYTSRGVREWSFYVSDVDKAGLRLNAALRDEPGLPLELAASDDPEWNEVEALLEGVKDDR